MIGNERGITLAEILAALAVIGIGVVGLLTVIPVATYGVQEGNQMSTATFLVEAKLEEVRNAVWSNVPVNDCLGVGPAAAPQSVGGCNGGAAGAVMFADEAQVAGYTSYSRNVRVIDCGVTACGGVLDPDLRLASVRVTFKPMTGTGVSATLKTVQANLLVARRL